MYKRFIKHISTQFSLEEKELFDIWENLKTAPKEPKKKSPKKKATPKVNPEEEDNTLNEGFGDGLEKLTKPDLVKMCKEKNIHHVGKKSLLIQRLRKNRDKVTSNPLIKEVSISRNEYNNFEHRDTGYVFDQKTHKVIGRQGRDGDETGKIIPLTYEDMERCKEMNFNYN